MDSEHKDILDRLDKVLDVVTEIQMDRAVLKDNVLKLEAVCSDTRLTKLETTQKNGKWMLGIAMALPSMIFGTLRYFKV